MTKKSKKKHIPFTEEELKNIFALGEVLRTIHNRLVKEGKCKVVDGKVFWLDIIDGKEVWLNNKEARLSISRIKA